MKAGEGKILTDRWASMLARDDVVDLKRKPVLRMRGAAVFAAVFRSFPNQPQQLLVH
jgi:hypothetical protein